MCVASGGVLVVVVAVVGEKQQMIVLLQRNAGLTSCLTINFLFISFFFRSRGFLISLEQSTARQTCCYRYASVTIMSRTLQENLTRAFRFRRRPVVDGSQTDGEKKVS